MEPKTFLLVNILERFEELKAAAENRTMSIAELKVAAETLSAEVRPVRSEFMRGAVGVLGAVVKHHRSYDRIVWALTKAIELVNRAIQKRKAGFAC